MSTAIGAIVRKRRLSRRFLDAVLTAPNHLKKTALELARTLPKRAGAVNLTEATQIVLDLWHEHTIALRSRKRYSTTIKPIDPLPKRLILRLQHECRQLQKCYRSYARQSGPTVDRVASFGEAQIKLHKEEGWVEYSKRFGNRRGITDAWYEFRLMRGWFVLPFWLQECGGMVTVAALRCPDMEEPGEEVWRARWGVQRKDYVETVSGYIVRQTIDGRSYEAHGRTLGGARGSITAQLPQSIAARTEAGRQRAERIERIKAKIASRLEAGQLNGYDVTVTLADSKRAGNCPDGTRHWAEKHFPGCESALVSEVLDVNDQRERVLLACLAAIRRQRPEVFAQE